MMSGGQGRQMEDGGLMKSLKPLPCKMATHTARFHTEFFPGRRGDLDVSKGVMRTLVHPLDLMKFWTHLRTGNIRFSHNTSTP